jgi:hypothetical protein
VHSALGMLALLGACRTHDAGDERCHASNGRELRTELRSPDGARRARVLRTNGGATTPFGVVVCVDDGNTSSVLASGDRYAEAAVRWHSATLLELEPREPHAHPIDTPVVVDIERPLPAFSWMRSGSIGCGDPPKGPLGYFCAPSGTCWHEGEPLR